MGKCRRLSDEKVNLQDTGTLDSQPQRSVRKLTPLTRLLRDSHAEKDEEDVARAQELAREEAALAATQSELREQANFLAEARATAERQREELQKYRREQLLSGTRKFSAPVASTCRPPPRPNLPVHLAIRAPATIACESRNSEPEMGIGLLAGYDSDSESSQSHFENEK